MRRSRLIAVLGTGLLGVLMLMPRASAQLPPGGTFVDDDGSVHEGYIEALVGHGVTVGCDDDGPRFCPEGHVTRGQMAQFLVSALDLPASSQNFFSDDNGHIFEPAINALRAAGITTGCNADGTHYCPDDLLTRGQMAQLLATALDLPAPTGNHFDDDDGHLFERAINQLFEAGITAGCSADGTDFCPDDLISRAQMATLLGKALGFVPTPPPPRERSSTSTTSGGGGGGGGGGGPADGPPTAVNDATTVAEDAPATAVDVLTNDTDADAGPKTVQSVTQPVNGTVAITGGGTGVSYTPDADFCGNDPFTYTLNGGSSATVTVAVTCVNDAPVVTTTATPLTYFESSGPIPVDAALKLVDDGAIAGATVQITSNHLLAEDELAFTDQLGITGSYDDPTGTMTLSGTTSVANYRTALRSVTYENSSGSPSTAIRTVSFQVTDDGALASNVATRDISIADPPPVVDLDANNSSGATAAEFHGYFAADAVIAAADTDTSITDNDTTIASAVIELTTRPDGNAEALLIDTDLADSLGIAVNPEGGGGFLLSGTATLANYEAVIASLQYINGAASPSSTDRAITVTVNDGISDSDPAFSRLSLLGGAGDTVEKQLYLSDPGQGMDRVDPVAGGDGTPSSVAVVPADLPGDVTSSTTFTQTAATTSPLVLPAGAAVEVTIYIQLTSGSLPAAPDLAASSSAGGTDFATLPSPPTVTVLGGGVFRLEWTGTVPDDVTVPTGSQISLTVIGSDTTYSFNIVFDSSTFPSQVQFATSTSIDITSLGVYGAQHPDGSPLTTTAAGQPAFVRFTVADPFGAADITSADLVIEDSAAGTVVSASLTDADVVASTAGSKTYEYEGTPTSGDTFTVIVTAHEGTEGVTATSQTLITTTTSPDLVVSKSDGGASVDAGASVAYTIDYANAGLGDATGVVLTELLPPGATFDAAGSTPGWVADGSSEFHFPVGDLPAGASGSVVFSVTVPSPVPAGLELLTNTVRITDDGTHGADSQPADNADGDSTPVNAAPDLVITKTDGGTSTRPGAVVLYQIHYSNVGTQNADGLVITDTLDINTTFNPVYSFGSWTDDGSGVVFTLPVDELAVGASDTVAVAVNVTDPLPATVTQIDDTVSIEDGAGSEPDLNAADNTATDSTPFATGPEADLQVTKTDHVVSVQPGDVVTYDITVKNAGTTAVTGATFTDNVPTSLTDVSYTTSFSGGATGSPPSGSGNSIGGSLDLPVDGTVVYTVTGTLDPDATGTLTNVATALPPAGILDPNTGNNTAFDADIVVPVADLSLGKGFTSTDLDGSGTLTPGDRIVFALTVTNSGPDPAYDVVVEDLLPESYTYVSDDAATNGGTYSDGTGLWTVGSTVGATGPDNTAVLHITAIVGGGGPYTNEAEIHSSGSSDPNSEPDNDDAAEDDFASVTPIVQPASDLSLDKTMALTSDLDGNGIFSIGDRVTFTLTLHNLGPNDAANVHVADELPDGYAFFSSTGAGVYTSGIGDWDVGTVSVGSSPTRQIVATVVKTPPASDYRNDAQVSASGSFDPDSTPADNSTTADDDASFTPSIADLSVTKGVDIGSPPVGSQVVFTVTLSNAGPDFATGVQLVDLLASGFTYVEDDSPGTYDPVTGVWNVGVMAPDTTQTLEITATVNPTGSYANTVQVTSSQQFDRDSTPNNNVPSEDDQATVLLLP